MFDQILVYPLLNILVAIYQSLVFLHIPFALGFSIILLTILIRLVMYPMITSQLRASKKMQDLAPHISNLKDRHKGDNTRIQQETMRLYKDHGVNPASGCLSAIVQMGIIVFGLYPAFIKIISLDPVKAMAELNSNILYSPSLWLVKPWDTHFFGVPLAQNPSQLLATMPLVVIAIPLITAALQFVQSKMMFSPHQNGAGLSKSEEKGKLVKVQPTPVKKDDFASVFQTQSMYIFPVMIGFFSYTFPVGLSLYWNTFTVFGIIQQYHITGLGGLAIINHLWKKNKNK